MKTTSGTWIVAVVLFITLCSIDCMRKREMVPVSTVAVSSPYQELDSATMISYNGSRKVWVLESRHIIKPLADTGHFRGDPVKITAFDSIGRQTSLILSDSGTADGAIQLLTVWGNVFVKAENGTRVNAKKLVWNLKTHRITSDTWVQLTTKKGDMMEGTGFEAQEDFSSWEFKSKVEGVIRNFKDRVEQEDDFY